MYQSTVRNLVASIIVFGHIFVFLGAFFLLGVFGPLYSEDTFQIILMASPVLAVSSVAAVRYVTGNSTSRIRGKKINNTSAIFYIGIPIVLILVVGGLFVTMYFDGDRFGPNELKISLGVVETFFGVFISLITESLFPASD